MPRTSYMCRIGKHDLCYGEMRDNMRLVPCNCGCHHSSETEQSD